ncbi:MAG: ABC transporter permease [Candidatus Omnitrophota bacterium]
MRTYFWIALRYLVNFKREKFISFMSLISLLGVAIGVMTLIIVLGVMSGFDRDLKSKILGLNYELIVDKPIGIADNDKIFAQFSSFPEVTAFSPFVSGQALLMSDERFIGVHIRGIDLAREMKINSISSFIKVGSGSLNPQELLVGEELFKQLDLKLGQPINIFSPITNKHYPFRVGGIFKSGYYDYDLNLVFSNIEDAQSLMFMEGFYSGVGLKMLLMCLV